MKDIDSELIDKLETIANRLQGKISNFSYENKQGEKLVIQFNSVAASEQDEPEENTTPIYTDNDDDNLIANEEKIDLEYDQEYLINNPPTPLV